MNKYHDTSLLDSYLSEKVKRDAEHTRGIRVENDRKHAFNNAIKFGAIILAVGIALYIALSGIGNALSFEQVTKNITTYDQNINGVPMQDSQTPGDELIDIEGLLNHESEGTQNSEDSENSSGGSGSGTGSENDDFWGESENSSGGSGSGTGSENDDFWGESENSSSDTADEIIEEKLEENQNDRIRNYVIFDTYDIEIGNIYALEIGRSFPKPGSSPNELWCYVRVNDVSDTDKDLIRLINVNDERRFIYPISNDVMDLMNINSNQLEEVRAQCGI